ncbi:tetratricopeptide repeat protein [Azospirillum sp.]|uniref:O-linked N-acetylglucosamine transferase family protein n=1 Tax=Azospirillum sp. TaxID=34012 RepID=UPI002D5A28AA|nr:tetratricopeptide repeat protein [Azospirillum sp.]HYF89084.1 tetratricopeptide repeat protein [Azospirillum sp.]
MSANQLLVRAVNALQAGQIGEAETLYRNVLALRKNDSIALHHLGLIAYWKGQLAEAADLIGKSLTIQPKVPEAHNNLGNVLKDLGRLGEAEAQYRHAIRQRPDNPEARSNLGLVLVALGRLEEAETLFRDAVRQRPDYPEALYNLANLLTQRGRFTEAAESYRQALAQRAVFPEALNNLGNLLKNQGALAEAEACYLQAVQQRPGFADAYNNLGIALERQGKYAEAVAAFTQALNANPDYADAYCGLGYVHQAAGRPEDALACFAQAVRRKPLFGEALSGLIFQQQRLCHWPGLPENERRMREIVRAGTGRASPFAFLTQDSTAEEQLACARLWAAPMTLPPAERLPERQPRDGGRIRIGYLSADFHDHATAYLMAELFERHDRARFEIRGYSYGPDSQGPMRRRLVAAFDHFADVRALSNLEAARLIHRDEVDILVDLKGYTKDARSEILAYRPAPVQVNFLGFPGTMGAEFVDYLIADPFIAPMDRQAHYSERLVHLPEVYQPNDTKRAIAGHTPDRAACGLPDEGFVFCSFNGLYKITPTVFAVWMRLLSAVPGSVLWLLDSNSTARENLRREAAAAGIDPARLVFSPAMPLAEHLARHRHADLFIDTLPVNAHTTASDALWAGLPVLTCAGETFVSRVAGSLVRAAGLPELVVSSLEEYEATALRLARNPSDLAALRERLARNRLSSPLFDIARFTAHLEDAFAGMWDIRRAGETPRAFIVPPRPAAELPPQPTAQPAPAGIAYERCPLCAATDIPAVLKAAAPSVPQGIVWCRCGACDHLFTQVHPSPDTAAAPAGAEPAVGRNIEAARPVAGRTVERVARLVPGGDWLDVDFGDAGLLLTAAEWGYRPCGVSRDAAAVQALRDLGGEAWYGGPEQITDGAGRFGVVSLIGVLERAPFPAALLADLRRLLRPGGVLVVQTPNRDAPAWTLADRRGDNTCWGDAAVRHAFTRAHLCALLEKHGFAPAGYAVGEACRFGMEVIAVRGDGP